MKDRRQYLKSANEMLNEYPLRVSGVSLDAELIKERVDPKGAVLEPGEEAEEFR